MCNDAGNSNNTYNNDRCNNIVYNFSYRPKIATFK